MQKHNLDVEFKKAIDTQIIEAEQRAEPQNHLEYVFEGARESNMRPEAFYSMDAAGEVQNAWLRAFFDSEDREATDDPLEYSRRTAMIAVYNDLVEAKFIPQT